MSIVKISKFMHSRGLVHIIMYIIAGVMAIGVVAIGLGGLNGKQNEEKHSAGGVMANIGRDSLNRETFDKSFAIALDMIAPQMGIRQGSPEEVLRRMGPIQAEQFRGRTFDELITQKLIAQAANREGIRVSSGDVDKAIEEAINSQINQRRDEFKKSGQTIDMVRAEMQKSLDSRRDLIEQSLIAQKLMEKMRAGVDASDKAVRASYDEVSFRRIVIGTKGRTSAQAEELAKSVYDKTRTNSDFIALVKQYSDDPMKTNGGLIPTAPMQYVQKNIARALINLTPGQIARPVKMADGSWAIMKLESRVSRLPADYNDPKKQREYRDRYIQSQMFQIQNELMSGLKASAKIEVIDPEMKAYTLMTEPATGDPKATLKNAIEYYKKAIATSGGDSDLQTRCFAQLAVVYAQLGSPMMSSKKEDQTKYRDEEKIALQNALKTTESSDLRLMLAELQVQDKKYDDAATNLQYVTSNAYNDPNAHQRMLTMYKQMQSGGYAKAAKLIADEQKWSSEYAAKLKAMRQAAPQAAPTVPARGK